MSGTTGCGKSELLAWLVHHGTQTGTPTERAVHAVVPSAGQSLSGTAWSLATQLGLVARSPDELLKALTHDTRRTVIVLTDLHDDPTADLAFNLSRIPHVRVIVESRTGSPAHQRLSETGCAELDLDLERWRDPQRFEQWQATHPGSEQAAASQHPAVNLSDPAAVCDADPWLVTAAYETNTLADHGGLQAAWFRAGQALNSAESAASRALTLLSVLGDRADPRYAPVLADMSSGTGWRLQWSRVSGDIAPPWPGPVTALTTGQGPLADCLLTAGVDGTVKAVRAKDATAHGRVTVIGSPLTAMTVLPDGTVLYLADDGTLRSEPAWAKRPERSGIEGLLDTPTHAQRLAGLLQGQRSTALAHTPGASLGTLALGDITGTVRTVGDVSASASLHHGAVTSLAAISLPRADGTPTPLIYSGGADGSVNMWSPGRAPMDGALTQRSSAVVSLDAVVTEYGPATAVAWADGLVEWTEWESGRQQTLRPGPPVRAVALDVEGRLFIGMDEATTCLTSFA
ncbi:hypothetical protein ACI2LO_30920 [Streptomyces sp. NPDC033754]|uniref:hypothetical protein n=1 Tax=unclassified Streptomyces TaxID=2593676 RepID=UPI0033D0D91C